MHPDYELYHYAANQCERVYRENIDLGTVEFDFFRYFENKSQKITQVLVIAGTNEAADWLSNFNLLSWNGIKIAAYRAANKIKKHIKIDPDLKLYVFGHSKGGLTAIAFNKLFKADKCVAFAPARGLRYWINREMPNTTIFIDPDDPVSKAGFINFGHPKCNRVTAKDDHLLPSIDDHFIEKWVTYTKMALMYKDLKYYYSHKGV